MIALASYQQHYALQAEFAEILERSYRSDSIEKIKKFLAEHPRFDVNVPVCLFSRRGPVRPIYLVADRTGVFNPDLAEILLEHGARLNELTYINQLSPTMWIVEAAQYAYCRGSLDMGAVRRVAEVFKRHGAQLTRAEYKYARSLFGADCPLDWCKNFDEVERELIYLFPVEEQGSSCVLV